MLAIGTVYWLVWAKLLPLLGFHIQHEVIQLPDGSERVRYVVSSRRLAPESLTLMRVACLLIL